MAGDSSVSISNEFVIAMIKGWSDTFVSIRNLLVKTLRIIFVANAMYL
jgi:hypothetical protein